jgi:hypothetical protein
MEATTQQPPKIKRSELHCLFSQFIDREDVKRAMAMTIEHKRANLLQESFHNVTGYVILQIGFIK